MLKVESRGELEAAHWELTDGIASEGRGETSYIAQEMVRGAELIVTMTAGQRFDILRDFPEVGNRVFLIKSFGTSKVPVDIPDPFGGSVKDYRRIRDEIDRAISDLVLFIHEGNS